MSDFVVHKLNIKILDNVDAGTSIESEPINIQSISLYCLQVTWNSFSAINPEVSLLGSNSLDENFVQIDGFIPNGITGGRLVNVEKAGYAYIKVLYSCTSGSGQLTVSINGKVS